MSEIQVEISDQQTHLDVRDERIREVIGRVLREEGIGSAEISVALVDDAAIHKINRDFLGHDYPTDVVSFLLDSESRHPITGDFAGVRSLEGELVVSTETAVREAAAHGWTADDELLLYVVHGLLHLCGYDDLTDDARPAMRRRELQVLAQWQLIPTGLEA
jgi:probable rRNA maturation factor